MSKIEITGKFITNFKDKQFFYFADRSKLGIILIQRGHLLYYNAEFGKIFGYSQEEISQWKKREFYKIVHPEDLQKLIQQFKIEDKNTVVVQFRGITKEREIIPIENSICVVKYNNINAYLSTYIRLDNLVENNSLRIMIELPKIYEKFFEYLELNFGLERKKYIENILKVEIESRNKDLNLF